MRTTTTAARPLVLVSCGARKTSTAAAPAAELYSAGSYSRMCLRAARAVAADTDIRIVSARYGLVELARVLAPYDTRIGDADAISAEQLHAQATAAGLLTRPVIVLAGAAYTRLVRHVWPAAAAPLEGSRGIGEHRHRLARIVRTGRLP